MIRDKVRIRFRKQGDLRLVSHHDLMRCFERMLRRAELPYRVTQGFHPKPRLIFALSLPLGVVGQEEVVELELDEELALDDLQARLVRHAPPGLEILSLKRIDLKTTAQVFSMRYQVDLPSERVGDVAAAIVDLLSRSESIVQRIKPETRSVNVRPFIRDLRVNGTLLEMDLWLTPKGTARPDELMRLLGLDPLLAQGAALTRSRLEIQDEIPQSEFAEGKT